MKLCSVTWRKPKQAYCGPWVRCWIWEFGVRPPGLTLPASFLLMGVSLSVSQACLQLVEASSTTRGSLTWLLTQLCLLLGWSWTCGFVIGNLSRRTVWASIVLCSWPCFVCLSKFQLQALSPVCLLWFLLPAALGVRRGLRQSRISLAASISLSLVLSAAMLIAWSGGAERCWSPPWWLVDGLMSWPAVYLVARARAATPI